MAHVTLIDVRCLIAAHVYLGKYYDREVQDVALERLPKCGTRCLIIETYQGSNDPARTRVFVATLVEIKRQESKGAVFMDVRQVTYRDGGLVINEQPYEGYVNRMPENIGRYDDGNRSIEVRSYEDGVYQATCILREQARIRTHEAQIQQMKADLAQVAVPENVRQLAKALTSERLELLLALAASKG